MAEVATVTFELAERAARAAVSALLHGVYRAEVELDGIGRGERIVATVTIDDEGISVDYAGTSEQSTAGINSVIQYSVAAPTSTR